MHDTRNTKVQRTKLQRHRDPHGIDHPKVKGTKPVVQQRILTIPGPRFHDSDSDHSAPGGETPPPDLLTSDWTSHQPNKQFPGPGCFIKCIGEVSRANELLNIPRTLEFTPKPRMFFRIQCCRGSCKTCGNRANVEVWSPWIRGAEEPCGK